MCCLCSSVTGESSTPVSVGLVAGSVIPPWLGSSGLDWVPYTKQHQVHQELNPICLGHNCSWAWAKQITFLTRQYLLAGFAWQRKRGRCYQPHPQYSAAFWAAARLCRVLAGPSQHPALDMIMSSSVAWLLCCRAFPPCRRWAASWGSVYSTPVVSFTLPLCALTAKGKIKHLMLLLCMEKYRNYLLFLLSFPL